MPARAKRVVQHADDAGGALVVRAGEAQPLDQLLVVRRARHPDRPGVRRVGEQRAEGDDEPASERSGEVGDRLGVRPPPQLGLGRPEEDDVADVVGLRPGEGVLGPVDAAGHAFGEADMGAGLGEVVELLGVDGGERLASPLDEQVTDGAGRRFAGVVPALERGDEDRFVQVRVLEPPDVVHRACTLSARLRHTRARRPRA